MNHEGDVPCVAGMCHLNHSLLEDYPVCFYPVLDKRSLFGGIETEMQLEQAVMVIICLILAINSMALVRYSRAVGKFIRAVMVDWFRKISSWRRETQAHSKHLTEKLVVQQARLALYSMNVILCVALLHYTLYDGERILYRELHDKDDWEHWHADRGGRN